VGAEIESLLGERADRGRLQEIRALPSIVHGQEERPAHADLARRISSPRYLPSFKASLESREY
jgi:hypothetical protein